MDPTVTLLKTAAGEVIAIYTRDEDARERADRYNADPDEDAPYTTERWCVQEPIVHPAGGSCQHSINGECHNCCPGVP